MSQLGCGQQALTELIRRLKDPIKGLEGLDTGDILRGHKHTLRSVWIKGELQLRETSLPQTEAASLYFQACFSWAGILMRGKAQLLRARHAYPIWCAHMLSRIATDVLEGGPG